MLILGLTVSIPIENEPRPWQSCEDASALEIASLSTKSILSSSVYSSGTSFRMNWN